MHRILALILFTSSFSFAQDLRHIGSVESNSDRVRSDTKIEVIAEGFTWSEGPVWIGDDKTGHLLFSDIPRNSIFRWSADDGVSLYMQPSGYTGVAYYGLEPGSNGLTLDGEARLAMCEHGDRRISVLMPAGGKRTLVDSYQGKRLNSPNDLIFARDGTLFFTDPIYGLPKRENDPQRELDFCGVFALRPDGKLDVITDKILRPNGIGLSHDQTRLIVAQSNPNSPDWTVFELSGNSVGEGKVIANSVDDMKQHEGLPDGLCVSSQDVIYASGPGGIYVMDFDGTRLGRYITGKKTSNCTLSPDESTLYVTADDVICRIRL